MIVSDDTVSKALAYLAEDPHPIALAQKEVTDAENERDRVFAQAYAQMEGSIKEKEMACEREADVISERVRLANAVGELARHRARVKAAEMIIEVWRSENANARAAERVR